MVNSVASLFSSSIFRQHTCEFWALWSLILNSRPWTLVVWFESVDFGRSSASFTFGVSETFILDWPKQSQDFEGESLGQLLDNMGDNLAENLGDTLEDSLGDNLGSTWGTDWGTTWRTTWRTTSKTTPWQDLEGESLGHLLLCFTLRQVVQQEIGHLNKYRCVLKEIVFLNKKSEELKN